MTQALANNLSLSLILEIKDKIYTFSTKFFRIKISFNVA